MKLNYYLSLLLTISLIQAQSIESSTGALKPQQLEPYTVKSSPLVPKVSDVTQHWSALDDQELDLKRAHTIGATLGLEPGVAQTFYGPNASRPIIRGLDSNRVRILQNGLDTFDVSSASVDHAVAVDPLLVDRIEILRGSSALLYGANAIGGVVNTLDRSIPSQHPDRSVEGRAQLGYSSVDDGWNTGTVAFVSTGAFIFQVNGSYRDTNDYAVPTFTLPDNTRTDEIANSHSETWTAGMGGSYIFEHGFLGAAFSQFETEYGVPNEEASSIELEHQRIEIKGEITPPTVDWLSQIKLQIAAGDYTHSELEADGEIAATYERNGIESRMSMVHTFGPLDGVIGLQFNYDEKTVLGEENAFAGKSSRNPAIAGEDTHTIALFLLENYQLSPQWTLDSGMRIEHERRDYTGTEDRSDTQFSASSGLVFKPTEGWAVSANLNYTERQPDSSELFSDGPHHATGSFEVGDPTLGKESALGFELNLRKSNGPVTGQLSAFYTRFDDYIYLADTGNELDADGNDPAITLEEALAEREYRSAAAEFYGFESALRWRVLEQEQWTVAMHTFADLIMARNRTLDDDLPRIAPWRIGAGIDTEYGAFACGIRMTHVGKQQNTAQNESPTGSYTLLDAYASYTWETEQRAIEWFIKGSNLTDELALVHTSFLRDTAPLPGASLETGLTVFF